MRAQDRRAGRYPAAESPVEPAEKRAYAERPLSTEEPPRYYGCEYHWSGYRKISIFNWPSIDPTAWKLEIDGLVEKPLTLTLDDIKARPRQEVVFTIECSGNHGFPDFVGGIGNARWAGTPLAPLLE